MRIKMDREQLLNQVKDALGGRIRDLHVANPRRVYITIDPADVVDATRIVHKDLGARFSIASGMQMQQDFEILYHFSLEDDPDNGLFVTLRVHLDHDKPVAHSIVEHVPAAVWIEREMHELLGIEFTNHPNMKRLLLSEDWPKGVYPLRHGKPWEGRIEKRL